MNNPDYDNEDMLLYCLISMVENFDDLPEELYLDAYEQIYRFIDMNENNVQKKPAPVVMDWEHDANMIIPAVNRVIGHEIRADVHMHWWTFLSAYFEIGECSFSHILNIRTKRAKGKKLEDWEKEFIRENKDLVEFKKPLSKDDIADQQALTDLIG